jgi:hypothetical protein
MSKNVFARYFKEYLLEAKQSFACVGDLLKKLVFRDKTKPLRF